MNAPIVSMVNSATETETRDVDAEKVIEAIRTGGTQHQRIKNIRQKFAETLKRTGDRRTAKRAVDAEKKKLPAVLWSGRFSRRASDALVQHSGLLPADLDALGNNLTDSREKLLTSPHLWTLFISPTGDGLKAVFRVPADAARHRESFRAVEQHVKELTGVTIDGSRKDLAGLCFVSHDPNIYHNPDAIELLPLQPTEKAKPVGAPNVLDLNTRQQIAAKLVGNIEWTTEASGFLSCPGKSLHTTADGDRDCEIHLDGIPTIHCFHDSCSGIRDGINHELRSRIGKAEAEPDRDEEKPQKSAATELVTLAEKFSLFHDGQNRAFVGIPLKGHQEIWPVASMQFRNMLAATYYKTKRKTANRNALTESIDTLQGKAQFDGPELPVFLRVAPHGGNILIDLCDPFWRVIEVSPTGLRILEKSPVTFIRTGSMRPLPIPTPDGSIAPLWNLLNVTPAQRPLVAGALLNYFNPYGPYFPTNFVGEQGSAKSCGARIVRMLIDPNENPLRSPPREERDLLAQAAANWCVALDNLSHLPPWLSDSLCRLATGGGHSARTLYTDLEEISLAIKRPVILNGIEDVAARPDLAERALQIELETIPDHKRVSERELWQKFEAARPVIFSGILDGLVCAVRELPTVQMDSLPRMADAALWATAGETALGFQRGDFMRAYRRNLDEGAVASVEAHPVGVVILRMLAAGDGEWTGEPAELLEALNKLATEEERRLKAWPQNARALGHALRRLAQVLRRAGVEYEREKRKRRAIRLCKARETSSGTSPTSQDDREKDDEDVCDVLSPALHASREEALLL